jgi:K+-sensing histidine kinase KdpD/ActR/RegA family two-component response regulator
MADSDDRPGYHAPLVGYGVAVGACVVAALVQYFLEPLLGNRWPLAVFSAAVAAAAWSGGSGPGLLATGLAALLGDYFFLSPRYALRIAEPADIVALALFILTGVLISMSMRRLGWQARSERDARAETERLLHHTVHLQDLTSALSRAKTPSEVINACLVELLHATDAAAGAFALATEDASGCEFATAVGFPAHCIAEASVVPLTARTPVTDAMRRQELVIVESRADAEREFPDRAGDPFAGFYQSAVVIPLVRANRSVGAVAVTFKKPRKYAGDEQQFLLSAGSRTAQALERARLYELTERARAEAEDFRAKADLELRERQRAEELLRESEAKYRGLAARTNRLYELSAGLSESITVGAVAQVIVRQGKVVVGASAASVAVLADGGREFETLYSEDYPRHTTEALKRFRIEAGLLSTAVVETRQPVYVASFTELQKTYPASAALSADGGYASAASLPLLVDNAVMGVLTFHFTAPVNFDAGYRALLMSVAQHCGQALDRARLYENAQAARNAAEEANRSKDEFLSTVSHELRTPLNAMLGWASLLRSGSLDHARTTRAIEAVFNNATRQAHLIEELLDVSRIVAGRAPIDPQQLDLGENVRGAVEAILPLAESKGIEVRVEPLAGVTVFADPRRLEQVFLNLLSNAVKFTPPGGHVAIDMAIVGDAVEVGVTDTGAGIDPAFLPHVFERFRQADSTLARSVGGLGLGLFIARRLVEAQGGRIRAHSDGAGRGARFTISLPVIASRKVLPELKPWLSPDRVDRPELAPALDGIRVLLVDDEADAREVMASALETCGATVLSVSSASDALLTLRRTDVDVLLSDLAMPGKDGYELIREIRTQSPSRIASIPAAAVTASARDDERQRALAAGFQIHLAKPVRPTALAQTVAQLARQRPAPDDLRAARVG